MAIFAVGMVRMLLLICGMCAIVVHSYCALSIPIKLYYSRNSLLPPWWLLFRVVWPGSEGWQQTVFNPNATPFCLWAVSMESVAMIIATAFAFWLLLLRLLYLCTVQAPLVVLLSRVSCGCESCCEQQCRWYNCYRYSFSGTCTGPGSIISTRISALVLVLVSVLVH